MTSPTSFAVRDGQFWLNGRPVLLQAGEFHYFRTPADQWAHRLGLLRKAGFNTVAAYIPWLWHQPQPDLSDLDGHSHPLRNLAGFLDLATEMGLYIIARPGPYIMAETINEGIPQWVFDRRPQAAFIAQDGAVQNIASYLHPDFLNCVEGWYQAVFQVLTPRQVTHGGNILMIQLDNEMGMIQWVRNIVDINLHTLERFAAYLATLYGKRLAEYYPANNLADFLHEQITRLDSPYAVRVWEDYRHFYRMYLCDYMAWLWDSAQRHGMDVPPVVNIHGFGNGGKTFPIGLSQLVEVMALDDMVSATDVYPIFIGEGNFHQLVLVNEMTKALQNPEQPLFSIEFQAGGNQDFGGAQTSLYDLHSRLCIGCGMRAINHYLFFDGENDPNLSPHKRHNWGHPVRKDGTLRRHYARYPQLSRVLATYGVDLVRSRPKTVTTIGFLINQYMTEVNHPLTRPTTDVLTHQRDVILFDFLARGLALTHRPFDALELSKSAPNAAQTPLLWVMMERQCDAETQVELVEYVREGGKLVMVGRICEETFDHTPCTILRDAFGIQVLHSDPPFTAKTIQAFQHTDVPVSFLETYSGDLGTVFATSVAGQPVGFVKQVGKGQVMMFGAALAASTLEDLDIFDQMAEQMGCPRLFTLSDWADVRLSEGEHGTFLFINNYQDDPLETTISKSGTALFGDNPIHIPTRRGLILPLEWRIIPGVMIHYSTGEITDVSEDERRLIIKTEPAAGVIELSIEGYRCAEGMTVSEVAPGRFRIHVTAGVTELMKG